LDSSSPGVSEIKFTTQGYIWTSFLKKSILYYRCLYFIDVVSDALETITSFSLNESLAVRKPMAVIKHNTAHRSASCWGLHEVL
jgi:hypothetical protein